MISHIDKPVEALRPCSFMMPIQAGAALCNERICVLADDEGDSIFDMNKNYSEGTVMYWLWKHAPVTSYIGLCHYRRLLDVDETFGEILESSDADIVTASPTFLSCEVRELFVNFLPECDLEVFLMAIKQCAGEYYDVAQEFFASHFYPPCNLFVMRWEIFQDYAATVFGIAAWVENYYAERCILREDRYMGFLIECFLGIFLMKHKVDYRIFCRDMVFLKGAE